MLGRDWRDLPGKGDALSQKKGNALFFQRLNWADELAQKCTSNPTKDHFATYSTNLPKVNPESEPDVCHFSSTKMFWLIRYNLRWNILTYILWSMIIDLLLRSSIFIDIFLQYSGRHYFGDELHPTRNLDFRKADGLWITIGWKGHCSGFYLIVLLLFSIAAALPLFQSFLLSVFG